VQTLTGSKDLQMVSITLRVLTRPDVSFLPRIYKELGTSYDDVVLPVKRLTELNSNCTQDGVFFLLSLCRHTVLSAAHFSCAACS
jgi:hypothetical protein